jgi:hypothetical protein
MADDKIGVISDNFTPPIPKNPFGNGDDGNFINLSISSDDIHKHKNIINSIHNEVTAYSYVSLIFVVVLVIFIGIMINDINCKILNMYYNTKKYNDHIIMKMFII